MLKIKEWINACAAGILFVVGYNILYLHTTISVAILKSIVIAIEANLILVLYIKIREALNF